MAAAFANLLGNIFLGAPEFLDQVLISRCLFYGVEIGALDVFDDGDFQRLVVGQFAHHHRHIVQFGELSGAPAALARHDLIAVRADGPDQDGRQYTHFLDRGREVGQRLLIKGLAGLVAPRCQKRDRQRARIFFAYGLALHGGNFIADQRRESAPQTARAIL